MFEINKQKFGAFVAKLRKEKHYTQKELAQRLFISDKAVSKWETDASLPDTTLLIPLADCLEVSVTELLMCEKMTSDKALANERVEDLLKTAVTYANDQPQRAYQQKSNAPLFFLTALVVGGLLTVLCFTRQVTAFDALKNMMILTAVFGTYVFLWVKVKLPVFYDEQRMSFFYDGFFRMNVPGLSFNNSNWPMILKTLRIWSCLSLIILPCLVLMMDSIENSFWINYGQSILLFLFLGSLFVPIYLIGKKYE